MLDMCWLWLWLYILSGRYLLAGESQDHYMPIAIGGVYSGVNLYNPCSSMVLSSMGYSAMLSHTIILIDSFNLEWMGIFAVDRSVSTLFRKYEQSIKRPIMDLDSNKFVDVRGFHIYYINPQLSCTHVWSNAVHLGLVLWYKNNHMFPKVSIDIGCGVRYGSHFLFFSPEEIVLQQDSKVCNEYYIDRYIFGPQKNSRLSFTNLPIKTSIVNSVLCINKIGLGILAKLSIPTEKVRWGVTLGCYWIVPTNNLGISSNYNIFFNNQLLQYDTKVQIIQDPISLGSQISDLVKKALQNNKDNIFVLFENSPKLYVDKPTFSQCLIDFSVYCLFFRYHIGSFGILFRCIYESDIVDIDISTHKSGALFMLNLFVQSDL